MAPILCQSLSVIFCGSLLRKASMRYSQITKSSEMQHSRLSPEFVLNKYERIYGNMIAILDWIKKNEYLHKFEGFKLLDFLTFSWEYFAFGHKKGTIQDCYEAFASGSKVTCKYLAAGNQLSGNKAKMLNDLSKTYVEFATRGNSKIDSLIELGGGCGRNLIRGANELKGRFSEDVKFVNAEYSPQGRQISENLFEIYGMRKAAKAIEFDFNNSKKAVDSLMPYLENKNVAIYSASSLEQIPYISKSLFETLELFIKSSSSLTVSFCEPITWQLAGLMPRAITSNSHMMAKGIGLNRNLYAMVQDWIEFSEQGIYVDTVCPSIFYSNYHISGLKVRSCDKLLSYTWRPRLRN